MGSLRNPIGPLPSSIYWRRRAVVVAVVVILVLLVVWLLNLGGGSGDRSKGGGPAPASSITPGPSHSGPAISQQPGGREEAGSEGGSEAGGTDSGGSGDGGSGEVDGASGWDLHAGDTPGGSDSGSGGSGGAPAGKGLPACEEPGVELTLRPGKKAYGPGEKPKFELTAKNKGSDCTIDLGAETTTVTVTDGTDEDLWSSDDCRREAGPAVVKVPADDEVTRTFTWNREPGAPDCGTPAAGSAAPGSYSIEVDIDGLKKTYAVFDLKKE